MDSLDDRPNMGLIIRNRLKERGQSVSWLARQLHCSRENMYHIFAKPWIDTEMLLNISIILEFNFFSYYNEFLHLKGVK